MKECIKIPEKIQKIFCKHSYQIDKKLHKKCKKLLIKNFKNSYKSIEKCINNQKG